LVLDGHRWSCCFRNIGCNDITALAETSIKSALAQIFNGWVKTVHRTGKEPNTAIAIPIAFLLFLNP
jgi:hypothetical protein